MTVSLAVATRIYELKLLGIRSIDDYPRILEEAEDAFQTSNSKDNADEGGDIEMDAKNGFHMNADDLKAAVERVKELRDALKLSQESKSGAVKLVLQFAGWFNSNLVKFFEFNGRNATGYGSVMNVTASPLPPSRQHRKVVLNRGQSDDLRAPLPGDSKRIERVRLTAQAELSERLKRYSSLKGDDLQHNESVRDIHIAHAAAQMHAETQHEDLKNVFFLKHPKLYFEVIKLNAMCISFYLALWFVNFMHEADKTVHPNLYRLLSFLPVLSSVWVYKYIIRSGGIIMGIIQLDADVVEKILEEEEDVQHLGVAVRDKIVRRLQSIDSTHSPEQSVFNVFQAMDIDNSNKLSRLEFKEALQAMRIKFSKNRWREIFRIIDSDYDGNITLKELFIFLFPNSNYTKEYREKEIIDNSIKDYEIQRWKEQRSKLKGGCSCSCISRRGASRVSTKNPNQESSAKEEVAAAPAVISVSAPGNGGKSDDNAVSGYNDAADADELTPMPLINEGNAGPQMSSLTVQSFRGETEC